jgi:hypothetical protein
VHVVGVSSLAAGHLTLVPALRDALAAAGRPDIMIVVGGVIPPGDFDELYAAGAAAIFPPGTVIADAAIGLLHKLAKRLGYDLTCGPRQEFGEDMRRSFGRCRRRFVPGERSWVLVLGFDPVADVYLQRWHAGVVPRRSCGHALMPS